MTYSSRGRSLTETVLAALFGGFLTGFMLVLCIGNFYRAKKAMERQKQRRLAKFAGSSGNGSLDSPTNSYNNSNGQTEMASTDKSGSTNERQQLLSGSSGGAARQRKGHHNNNNTNHNGNSHYPPVEEDLLLQQDDEDDDEDSDYHSGVEANNLLMFSGSGGSSSHGGKPQLMTV